MSRQDSCASRKILITGSSIGIGRATAEILLDRGAVVVGIARDHSKFTPVFDRYDPVPIDLSNLNESSSALDLLARRHPDVDAVISNAGSGHFGQIEQFSARQIRDDIALNLTSHLLVARSFLPVMKRRGHGDLIIMGSEAALRGTRKGSVYCAAKFGLRGAAQALADECGHRNVRVTLVNPGFVRTSFFNNLNIEPQDTPGSALAAEDVAVRLVEILDTPLDTILGEINIAPPSPALKHKGQTSS